MLRVYTGKIFIVYDDNVTPVKNYFTSKELKKDVGYLYEDYVFVYHGKIKDYDMNNEYPCGLYKVNDEYLFVYPKTAEDRDRFHRDRIIEFNVSKMYDEIEKNKNDFLSEEEIEIIQANMDIFSVAIRSNDDFLKRLIKEAINRKEINLKIYKDKFKNDHSLNNMKSALNKKSKMSVSYFLDWCEILGLDWSMSIWDNGTDKISRLNEPIMVNSSDGILNNEKESEEDDDEN
jgi:hypothetical protein